MAKITSNATLLSFFSLLVILQTIHSTPYSYHDEFGRIIGGSNATPGEFPWQISVQLKGTNTHMCGGSILSPTKIASAAHCCNMIPEVFRVVAGAHNILTAEPTQQIVDVERFIIHPKYNQSTIDYDACKIFLKSPLTLNNRLVAVPLCSVEPQDGAPCIATGWGTTNPSGEFSIPPQLLKVVLPIFPKQTCRSNFAQLPDYPTVTERMVCAGSVGGQSACNGDSGGSLACGFENSNTCLAGVASWTRKPCAQEGFATVFVNIAQSEIQEFFATD